MLTRTLVRPAATHRVTLYSVCTRTRFRNGLASANRNPNFCFLTMALSPCRCAAARSRTWASKTPPLQSAAARRGLSRPTRSLSLSLDIPTANSAREKSLLSRRPRNRRGSNESSSRIQRFSLSLSLSAEETRADERRELLPAASASQRRSASAASRLSVSLVGCEKATILRRSFSGKSARILRSTVCSKCGNMPCSRDRLEVRVTLQRRRGLCVETWGRGRFFGFQIRHSTRDSLLSETHARTGPISYAVSSSVSFICAPPLFLFLHPGLRAA